jgi:hypothetical protein
MPTICATSLAETSRPAVRTASRTRVRVGVEWPFGG